jgi:hypothetical protein
MQENKSLVQEALIQMKNVEEAIAENAKGILHSTMKEEINQLVKESLSEQDEIDLDTDIDTDVDTDDVDMDVDMDVDDDTEDMDMDVDMNMDMDSEDESPIDLTDASDEEILKVFKAMGEEDGIIVKKDGEDIHLTDNDADTEYLVKLGESEEDEINMNETDEIMNQTETDESVQDVIDAIFSKDGDTSEVDIEDIESDDEMMESDDDEVVYEIHLDDEDEMMESDDEDEMMESDDEDEMMESDDEDEMMESDDEDEMMESDDEDEMMESDDEDEMMESDDEDEESIDETYNHKRAVREGKSTVKPKGVGIGSGPKFTYKNKAAGGFKEDKKEGPKSVGTGKAKFEYKKGENMEAKSKVVKAETKEGYGSKKHEFKRKKVDGVEKKAGTKDGHYKDYEKTETKEAARTYGNGSKEGRGLRKGITNNRNYVYSNNGVKVESTQAEVSMLREKNEEYRKALNVFREKLNEVAIFNSNLAYATRLFTEHSTTKKEKINILRRFDGVETLKESKNLYKSIKDELSTGDTQPITESVGSKLNKQVSTGSSVNLIESKTYENPQFLRMKDLMSKLG